METHPIQIGKKRHLPDGDRQTYMLAGHNKYVSCLPHYLVDMKDLPIRVKEEFRSGNFTVRKRSGKYNGVWTDMALEQSYNRDA